jgi:hypothetical protein
LTAENLLRQDYLWRLPTLKLTGGNETQRNCRPVERLVADKCFELLFSLLTDFIPILTS